MNEKDDIPGVLFGYVIRYLSTFVANEENRGSIKNKDEAQNARSSRGHQAVMRRESELYELL